MSRVPKLVRLLSAEQRAALDDRLRNEHVTYAQLADELRAQGVAVVVAEDVRRYALHVGARQNKPVPLLKIDRILSPEHRKEYEALLSDARVTKQQANAWLRERGYDVSLHAIGSHRRRFQTTLHRVRDSALFAGELMEAAGEPGQVVMVNGAQLRAEQVLLEQLVRIDEHEQLDMRQYGELFKTFFAAVGSRQTMEKIRRDFEEEKRRTAEAARAAVNSGATPAEVADRVREILGV